jgi:hypothetical protein
MMTLRIPFRLETRNRGGGGNHRSSIYSSTDGKTRKVTNLNVYTQTSAAVELIENDDDSRQ